METSSAQRPVMQNYDVFFDLRMNQQSSNNGDAGDLRCYQVHYDVIVLQ